MTKPALTLKSAGDLVEAGLLGPERFEEARRVGDRYAIGVTPTVAALIDPRDAADPIARQFLPDASELEREPAELADPIGDDAHSPVPGIVHRGDLVVHPPSVFRIRPLRRSGFIDSGADSRGELGLAATMDPETFEIGVRHLAPGEQIAASRRIVHGESSGTIRRDVVGRAAAVGRGIEVGQRIRSHRRDEEKDGQG